MPAAAPVRGRLGCWHGRDHAHRHPGLRQPPARRPPRSTRPLLVRFVSTVGASASFYLLLSAVPEYARAAGARAGTAGLTTTALTLSSVAAYLVAPRLIARYGYRPVLAAGLTALGAPALLLAAPSGIGASLAVIRPSARSAASASPSPAWRAMR